jgi:hypothetical protein
MKPQNIFFHLFLLLFFFISVGLWADQLSVDFNTHVSRGRRLESNLSIVGDISYDTIDAIRNGITAKFNLTVQLHEGGGIFGGTKKLIDQRSKVFTISFDVWENRFIVNDRRRREDHYVNISSQLLAKINEVMNPFVLSLPEEYKRKELRMRAKIKIQTIKLYPPFGIFLLFFDPWNYESEWIDSDIFMIEELR